MSAAIDDKNQDTLLIFSEDFQEKEGAAPGFGGGDQGL
jgi:hypothetical protein